MKVTEVIETFYFLKNLLTSVNAAISFCNWAQCYYVIVLSLYKSIQITKISQIDIYRVLKDDPESPNNFPVTTWMALFWSSLWEKNGTE